MLNQRAKKLVQAMPEGFEAALLQTQQNKFYLLDFDAGDAGTLLLLPDQMLYIIDSRYIEIARREIKDAEVVLEKNALNQVREILSSHGVKKLYVEDGITVAQCEKVKSELAEVEVEAGPALSTALRKLRVVKDEEEISRMAKAQSIADECFTHIQSFIKEGVREIDIALEIEFFMRSHGAQNVSFDTIAVSGANSSLPHGVPGEKKIQAGDFITLDFGAKYKGYCSDMTRTLVLGKPSEEQAKVYDMVLRAHLAGIKAAGPGKKGWEIDKVARDIIYGEGYEGYFGHGLGHGVGIDIHEDPRFSPLNQDEILPGMVMTIEPGCYLPGKFGCRIEDMVLITESGCKPFPTSKKELICL